MSASYLRGAAASWLAGLGAILVCCLIGSPALMAAQGAGQGLTIASSRLVPGASSHVSFEGPDGVPVRSGRVVVKLSPQAFVDTPAISFPGAPADLVFGLTHLGPGRFAVEFAVPSDAPALGPGRLFSVSGVLMPSLHTGRQVHASVGGALVTEDGREVDVDLRRVALPLVADSYPITLHVQDGYDLHPGSKVVVELYTYNPKLISDGQICLRFDASVFASVESIGVQGDPDVSYVAGPEDDGVLLVQFSSPTSSINRYEGSIIRIGMRLAADLPDGLETTVDVDLAESFLRDHSGELVNLRSEAGRFRVSSSYEAPD